MPAPAGRRVLRVLLALVLVAPVLPVVRVQGLRVPVALAVSVLPVPRMPPVQPEKMITPMHRPAPAKRPSASVHHVAAAPVVMQRLPKAARPVPAMVATAAMAAPAARVPITTECSHEHHRQTG